MKSIKTTGRIIGALFFTIMLLWYLGFAILDPILKDVDYLTNIYPNKIKVTMGVLAELIETAMVLGLSFILFPILKKYIIMKNLFILVCLLAFNFNTVIAQAPSYTDFEWDIVGIGLAIPIGENDLKGGIAMGGEVRFNATDEFSIGLGSEFSFFDVKNLEKLDVEEEATIGFSYTSFLSGDYYLSTTSSRRAFFGLGVGYSDIGDIEITDSGDNVKEVIGASGMSLSPRIGYEFGHARFLLNYNIGLKEELSNYISLKVSLTLWGGYQGE